MGIGAKIRQLREERGMRLVDLAEKAGVTPACICYWEGDSRSPQLKNLKRLSEALDVPMSYFLTDEPSAPETIIHD